MPRNRAFRAHERSKPPMKHSSSQHCADCANAAARLPRNAGRGLIWIYRHTLSPLVGYNCRHLPTCSVYGDEAIERFGLWGGGWMTLARLLRCQPWGTSGIDNVPLTMPSGREMVPALAVRTLARRQRAVTSLLHCFQAQDALLP